MPAHGVSPHSLMPPSRMPKAIFFRPSKSRKDPILKTEKSIPMLSHFPPFISPEFFVILFCFLFFFQTAELADV